MKNNKDIKKNGLEELVEKSKKEGLSAIDLDEAMEEMDYDMDALDKLYETLEDNGIPLPDDISSSEISEIESEVEKFSTSDSMEKVLEQGGVQIDDPVRMYLKEIGRTDAL